MPLWQPRLFVLLILALLITSSCAWSQLVPGSVDVHWNEGASNCARGSLPALQVHAYNSRTFILRESLCATFEAPFMYLLIGSEKAVLVDTGDIADSTQMPLAKTVMQLLPGEASAKLPLLVVHTHRHLDHRAGDAQFTHVPNVEVVGFDIGSVRRFYNFSDWPNGLAKIALGDRIVDVIPTPGHNETEVSFYDRNTGLVFTGDFLLPGRLLIENASADLASAKRMTAFIQDRPVSYVLGGHIEMDRNGNLFSWQSQYHPNERPLQMTKDDVLGLPAAIEGFNGFYSIRGHFIMMNSIHILVASAVLIGIVLVAFVWMLVRYFRKRGRVAMNIS
jgi:hydroxyacylglutathione hydrolase